MDAQIFFDEDSFAIAGPDAKIVLKRLHPDAPHDRQTEAALLIDVRKRLRSEFGDSINLQVAEHTPCEAGKLYADMGKRRKLGK